MIRQFTATDGERHALDLDAAQVDGADCTNISSDWNHEVRFETAQGTIACELEAFWHEIAGPVLSAREAALLLAECLARQILLQHQAVTLHALTRLLSQAGEAVAPSLSWLTTRLDPLARSAMRAYDGSDAMTEAIARIVQQTPETIRAWAHQLGLDAPAPSEETPALPAPTLYTDEPAVKTSETRKPFSWTPERLQDLEIALGTCTGSTVAERARHVAQRCGWPIEKVQSKLYELRAPGRHAGKPVARETAHADEQEGDRRAYQLEAIPL